MGPIKGSTIQVLKVNRSLDTRNHSVTKNLGKKINNQVLENLSCVIQNFETYKKVNHTSLKFNTKLRNYRATTRAIIQVLNAQFGAEGIIVILSQNIKIPQKAKSQGRDKQTHSTIR